MPLVECVPNFSEGRSVETLDALRTALTSVPGVRLLDVQADASHNRSVFTFVASPEAAAEAAFRAVRLASQRIDLRVHKGEHPRMGAADVVPFIPLEGVTMDDCVALAKKLGERIGKELEIPVFLYERAASRPERARTWPTSGAASSRGSGSRSGRTRRRRPTSGRSGSIRRPARSPSAPGPSSSRTTSISPPATRRSQRQ